MTKKELISTITNFLKEHKDREVIVKDFSVLRNGRWGMHPYCICYQEGDAYNAVFVRPWSGANVYWRARLEELTKSELLDIVARM